MLICHAALPLLIAKIYLTQNQRASYIAVETFTIRGTSLNSTTVLEYNCSPLNEYDKVAIAAKSLGRATGPCALRLDDEICGLSTATGKVR